MHFAITSPFVREVALTAFRRTFFCLYGLALSSAGRAECASEEARCREHMDPHAGKAKKAECIKFGCERAYSCP